MRTLLLLCLLLLNPALAEDRLQVEGYPLQNGLHVLLKPTAERGHVAIRLVVGVGFEHFSCAAKELPHLLEHLLFSGIDASGEAGLEARMQALGGEWNAYTRDSDTTYVLEVPAANQRAALDLLLASLLNTELDARKVAAAKRVVERENGGHYSNLQRLLDQQNVSREAHQQLAVELGLACAERAPLAPLSLTQLEQLRRDWYVPNNMNLIVVGDLDPLLPAYLDRSYGALPAADIPPPRELAEGTEQAAARRSLFNGLLGDNASLHWLLPEPWVGEHDHATWELLRDYLDWQLYQELRLQRSLSYGPWSERSVYGSRSFFSLNAELERADLTVAEQVLRALGQRLHDNGLDAATFQRLQQAAIAKQRWAVQGNSALADYYWNALGDYHNGRFSDPAKALQAVSLEQANSAVRQLFGAPGYLRIEQPLLSMSALYGLAGSAALLILALLAWRRRKG
ncbi:M16 family metallopeptidase [Pseudomonas sp. UBA2684]|uniref:M16 family metallopeptidase n=1 Tax=Pseudomonas sp. UBA2684 TaxID=1947311 RepID=UPI000E9986D0|nr:insulinase family protein [Pseudomonas sp. UBA2684]HBX55253.1 insulinase family protein [Pseudomonas sp.]